MRTRNVALLGLLVGLLAAGPALAQTAALRTAPKGSTPAGTPTSSSIDANTQALDVNIRAGGGTGGGPSDTAPNTSASESDTARQKTSTTIRLLDTSQGAGSQLVTGKGDQTSGLWVNCKAGCSGSAGDTTASNTLGAGGAVVSVAMAGENGAIFNLASGGNLAGTLVAEASADGTTSWYAAFFVDPSAGTTNTSITVSGGSLSGFSSNNAGILYYGTASHVRVRVSAYTSGSSTGNLRAALTDHGVITYGVDPATGRPYPIQIDGAGIVATKSYVRGAGGSLVDSRAVDPSAGDQGLVVRNIPSGTQTISGTATVQQSTASSLKAQVQGEAASGAAKAGNPVQIGGVFNTTQPTVSSGQAVEAQATARGAQIVAPGVDGFAVTGTVTTTPPSNASTNVAQFGGTNVVTGTGAGGSGIPRVTISNDSSLAANQSVNVAQIAGASTATAASGVQKVGITGNTGAAMDAAGQNATAPANELLVAGQFNTTPTTITDGKVSPLQLDSSGKLIVNCGTGCSGSASDTTTGSTALGAGGAHIDIALAGQIGVAFQLQSGGTGVYTVTPKCSFDNGAIYNTNGYIQDPVTGAVSLTATIASGQATTDYPVMCPQGASHAQMNVTSYTSGTANWLARATATTWPPVTWGVVTTNAPSYTTGTINTSSLTTAGALRSDVTSIAGTAPSTAGKLDVKGADGDVFVRQATAANLKAEVVGTKTNNNAAPGATNVGALTALANAAPPSWTEGNLVALSTDLSGALRVSGGGGGTQYNQGTASTSTDSLTMAGAIRHDTATVDAGVADGDRVGLSTDSVGRLRVTATDTTQPISGTVTANAGTNLNTSALALDATVGRGQASTTSGQTGPLVQGAVTTAAPTYTTAQTDPLSLQTDGSLRTAVTNTVTVSGTVTTTPPSNASTNVAQFGGTNVSTGTGAGGAGIPRVTLSNDSSLAANQSVNLNQVAGNAVNTGTGTAGTGTARVAVASDSTLTSVGSITNTVTVAGAKTNNNAAPGATNVGTLPGVATTAAPSYTEGNQVALSTDLTGALRVAGGGGLSVTDSASFTAASSAFTPAGGEYNPNATPLTSGQQGTLALTANRAVQDNLRNSYGQEVGAASPTNPTVYSPPLVVALAPAFPAAPASPLLRPAASMSRVTSGTPIATPVQTVQVAGAVASNGAAPFVRCDQSKAISTAASGFTELVALVSGKSVFVCGYTFVSTSALSVKFSYGTGSACGTGTVDLTGAMAVGANGGVVNPVEATPVFELPAGQAFCINLSGATQVSGHIKYTQF